MSYNEEQFRRDLLKELKDLNKNISNLTETYSKIHDQDTPEERNLRSYLKGREEYLNG